MRKLSIIVLALLLVNPIFAQDEPRRDSISVQKDFHSSLYVYGGIGVLDQLVCWARSSMGARLLIVLIIVWQHGFMAKRYGWIRISIRFQCMPMLGFPSERRLFDLIWN